MGERTWGLGFRVGLRVEGGERFRVAFRVEGGERTWGSGFRVEGGGRGLGV